MFRAVVKEDIVALRELLQIPRNVNAVNKAGETPLDIAISRKKKAAEQLIRAHGGLTHIALAAKQGREVGPTSIVAAAAAMRKMKDSVSKSSVSSPASPSRPATAPAADEVDGVVTRRIDLSATPATGAEFFDSPVAPAAASDPLLGVDTKEPQTDPELVAVISSMKEEMRPHFRLEQTEEDIKTNSKPNNAKKSDKKSVESCRNKKHSKKAAGAGAVQERGDGVARLRDYPKGAIMVSTDGGYDPPSVESSS